MRIVPSRRHRRSLRTLRRRRSIIRQRERARLAVQEHRNRIVVCHRATETQSLSTGPIGRPQSTSQIDNPGRSA